MGIPDSRTAQATQKYYDEMTAARKRIVLPTVGIILFVFFLQQVLTNFTDTLDGFAFEGMSWAYIYAYLIFVLVAALTTIYARIMDKVELENRPAELEETAAHYDHFEEWEEHQASLEEEELVRDELQKKALADEIRARRTHKEDKP